MAVIAKDEIVLNYPYSSSTVSTVNTKSLYLEPGAMLGIYVDLKSCDTPFQWSVIDNNGKVVDSKWNTGVNKVMGAPVGYYYLKLDGGGSEGGDVFPCYAKGILSIQK